MKKKGKLGRAVKIEEAIDFDKLTVEGEVSDDQISQI